MVDNETNKERQMVTASIGTMDPEKAEKMKEVLQGQTYMDFNVICGVQPGPSRYVTITTEYDTTEKKLLEYALYTFATRV